MKFNIGDEIEITSIDWDKFILLDTREKFVGTKGKIDNYIATDSDGMERYTISTKTGGFAWRPGSCFKLFKPEYDLLSDIII